MYCHFPCRPRLPRSLRSLRSPLSAASEGHVLSLVEDTRRASQRSDPPVHDVSDEPADSVCFGFVVLVLVLVGILVSCFSFVSFGFCYDRPDVAFSVPQKLPQLFLQRHKISSLTPVTLLRLRRPFKKKFM